MFTDTPEREITDSTFIQLKTVFQLSEQTSDTDPNTFILKQNLPTLARSLRHKLYKDTLEIDNTTSLQSAFFGLLDIADEEHIVDLIDYVSFDIVTGVKTRLIPLKPAGCFCCSADKLTKCWSNCHCIHPEQAVDFTGQHTFTAVKNFEVQIHWYFQRLYCHPSIL